MLATVVPAGMPGPCTGWPTVKPTLLGTVIEALPVVVLATCEEMVGAAKVAEVTAPVVPPAGADSVTTPVAGL